MTDATPDATTLTSAPKDSSAQTIVALAIVGALVVIGVGALIAAVVDRTQSGAALTVVGTAIGALATALNAPNGLASMISAAKKPGTGGAAE